MIMASSSTRVDSSDENSNDAVENEPPSIEPDVYLRLGDVVFPSRRRLLARNSSYFECMFSGAFAESGKGSSEEDPIDIHRIAAPVMKTCLDIFRNDLTRLKESDLPRSNDGLIDLWQAADMLQASELMRILERRVFPRRFTRSNVVALLEMARQRGRNEFINRALLPFIAFYHEAIPEPIDGLTEQEKLSLSQLKSDWFTSQSPAGPCASGESGRQACSLPESVVLSPFDRFLLLVDPVSTETIRRNRSVARRPQWMDFRPKPYLSVYYFASLVDKWTLIPAGIGNDYVRGEHDEDGEGPVAKIEVVPTYENQRTPNDRSFAAYDVVRGYLIVTGGVKDSLDEDYRDEDEPEEAPNVDVPDSNPIVNRSVLVISLKSMRRLKNGPGKMKYRRLRHALVHDDKSIYVIGGVGGSMKGRENRLLLSVEKCPLESLGRPIADGFSWQSCAPMQRARLWDPPVDERDDSPRLDLGHSAVLRDGYIYVLGPALVLQRYCVATDAWTTIYEDAAYPLAAIEVSLPRLSFLGPGRLVVVGPETWGNLCFDLVHLGSDEVKIIVEDANWNANKPLMATNMNGKILFGSSRKISWDVYRQEIAAYDVEDGMKEIERCRLKSSRWAEHVIFPVFATPLAEDFEPLPP